jgi:hypothetical protein
MNKKRFCVCASREKIEGDYSFGSWIPVVLLTFMVFGASSAFGQVDSSKGSGGGSWSTSSTWSTGSIPTGSNDVIIAAGDSVYTSGVVSCRGLIIRPGAKLVLNTGKLHMNGDFSIGPNAWFYDNDSLDAWPDSASSYDADPTSNFVIMSNGGSNLGTQTADSVFGNVYVLRSGVSCGANLTIEGNLTINYNSTSSAFRGISATIKNNVGITSLTHHVMGNVYLITGIWSAVDGDKTGGSAMSCIWNVDGNVTVGDYSTASGQARFGPFSSDDAGIPNFGEFNIGGNLSIMNGARLQPGNSTSNNTTNQGEINIGGNLTLDTNAAYAVNSKGENFSINFVGKKTQVVSLGKAVSFSTGTTAYMITLNDTVAASSTVEFTGGKYWQSNCPNAPDGNGAFVVYGKLFFGPSDTLKGLQSFILKPGGTLGTANVNGIDTTTGSIQVSGAKSLPSTASYIYDGTAAQAAGNALPSSVNNLTIDTAQVTLAASDTVTGTLTLNGGGKLMLNSNSLFVSSNKANAVVGDSASYIVGDSLTRAQGTATGSYLFPIGTATSYRGLIINYNTAPAAATNLTASFIALDPTSTGLPGGISGYWNGGYWKVSSSGTPGGVFNLSLYSPEAAAVNTPCTIIGKPSLSDPWVGLNLTSAHSSTISGKTLTESGVSSYEIYGIGYGTLTSVKEVSSDIPTKIGIGNFPNPFNPSTVIRIAVPKNAHVTLTIYNALGQKIVTLVDQDLTAGYYDRLFDGSHLASGVYFSRLNVADKVVIGKMLMLK